MDESLWSTRNVAEYAYCPRLFYFMEVEGIALDSDDVERGRAIHRRVDKPSTLDNSEDENDVDYPKKIRSLTLTSHSLKLTATIDITEIEGHRAVPIEYRKGYPHRKKGADEEALQDVIVEPWPTDQVQLGLHAILLEEAGYCVEEAVVYYAKEKRKLRFPVDEALKKEALDVFESAKQCSLGSRPLPLMNDPKCPRCSLQPICLPDEINYQRNNGANEELTPRKLWPPHEDGIQAIAQGAQGMQRVWRSLAIFNFFLCIEEHRSRTIAKRSGRGNESQGRSGAHS